MWPIFRTELIEKRRRDSGYRNRKVGSGMMTGACRRWLMDDCGRTLLAVPCQGTIMVDASFDGRKRDRAAPDTTGERGGSNSSTQDARSVIVGSP